MEEGKKGLDVEIRTVEFTIHSGEFFFLRRMNYGASLGHAHPKIPKAAVSTKRSWHSESYQRAGSNAAGHRDEPDL